MATAKKKKTNSKGRTIKADFTKVKEGGRVRVKEGDYKVKIKDAELTTAQSSGATMIVFTYEFLEGKAAGKTIKDRVTIQENTMWRLRNLLVALGKKVPKKVVNVNIDDLIGMEFGITCEDNEYEGKISSQVSDYVDLESLEDDEPDEDDDDDDEDEDDEDEDEDDDDDEDEDEDEDDLEDLDVDEL